MRCTIILALSLVSLILLSGCMESAGEAFFRLASRGRCIESSKGVCEGNALSMTITHATTCATEVVRTDCEFGCFGPKGKARCRTREEAIKAGVVTEERESVVTPSPRCGNGVVEGTEQCDGGVCAGGARCTDCTCPASMATPVIAVASPVHLCGNGVVDPPEACDPGNSASGVSPAGSCTGGAACTAGCACPTGTAAAEATPTYVDCVTAYGTGAKCVRWDMVRIESEACTARGGHLETHCADADTPCRLLTVEAAPITLSPMTGRVVSTVSPAAATTSSSVSSTTTTTTTYSGISPCCVKCVVPPTLAVSTVVTQTPIVSILGHAVVNTGLVECSSFGKGFFCVATETEFQDECKGNGEMYPSASCLTESEAKGFCVIC